MPEQTLDNTLCGHYYMYLNEKASFLVSFIGIDQPVALYLTPNDLTQMKIAVLKTRIIIFEVVFVTSYFYEASWK